MDFVTVSQAAKKWNVSERSVRNYCTRGRVPGATLIGKTWSIPEDAVKPSRVNARRSLVSPLLNQLRANKRSGLKDGIYNQLQVELTYNSTRIAGSKLSLDQVRQMFESATLNASGELLMLDDIIATVDHFQAIDYVINNAERPLTEEMIKTLHHLVMQSTSKAVKSDFAVGDYKHAPENKNIKKGVAPEEVETEMSALLESYEVKRAHNLEEILDFHVKFERIHPFQDGNGRVGRLIMLKECLASGVVPFIIVDETKPFYYRGIEQWDVEKSYLLDTSTYAQYRFREVLDYFGILY